MMVAKLNLDPRGVFMFPHGDARTLIRRGFIRLGKEWREKYGINLRWSFRSGGVPVYSGVVKINGQHYRASANRSRIMFHSGWVPEQNRYSDTFWAKDPRAFEDQAGMILWHEWGHTRGLRFPPPDSAHSKTRADLMHPWVGRDLVETRAHFVRMFGFILKKAEAELETVEAEFAKPQEIQECRCLAVVP